MYDNKDLQHEAACYKITDFVYSLLVMLVFGGCILCGVLCVNVASRIAPLVEGKKEETLLGPISEIRTRPLTGARDHESNEERSGSGSRNSSSSGSNASRNGSQGSGSNDYG
jgi:hypothetical protein